MTELTSGTIYAVGLPIAFALIAVEAIFSAWRNIDYYHFGDSLGSLGLFLGLEVAQVPVPQILKSLRMIGLSLLPLMINLV